MKIGKYFKKITLFSFVFIFLFVPAINIFADPVMGVPVGDNVLVIYLNRGYPTGIKNSMVSALTAAGATVTQVVITEGDADGIWDDLQAQLGCTDVNTCLDSFCEVWDLRFNDAHQGIAYMNSGVIYDDTITSGCPTCDLEIFRNFMINGGHIYLQGEHQNFYGRNESVLQFISDVAGAVSYPSLITAAKTWNTFAGTPENFSTDFNTLTQLDTYFVGTILLSGIGNGHPITTDGTYSLDIAFMPSDLFIGAGKLFVSFDTNMFDAGDIYWTASGAQEMGYVQNIYDFLSGCYKYNITKTISPDDMCTGDTAVYTICYDNTGTKPLTNVSLWDTIPSCFSVQSVSAPATGNTGNLYWWNFANIAAGASACINITVRADSVPPCP